MSRVIGLGGVFIKFSEPGKMKDWYNEVLGIHTNDYGILYKFNHEQAPGFLQIGTFEAESGYFRNDQQKVMLNFRVDNMEEMIERLNSHKVKLLNEMETYEYGKFIHIQDPEGNTIELWEPIDKVFEPENWDKMN